MRTLFAVIALWLCTILQTNAQNEFITTWQTTTDNETITIPTTGAGYLYDIDWGDGNSDTGQTGSAMHTYAMAGTYTVEITGTFPRIYFNNTGDKSKIRTIAQWGTTQWSTMDRAFRGCNNLTLTATDTPDLSSVTDMGQMFQNATAFADTGGAIGSWNVSNVELMDQVFMNTSFNSNINSWNVSKATNMRNLFSGCSSFNQSLNSWTPIAAENMSGMFRNCSAFNGNISSWNVSTVTNFSNMFSGASIFNQNIGSWTVSAGTNFSGMFQNADDFNQNIGSWNMSNAENLSSMFAGADEFNQNIGSWNTSKVTTMGSMFSVAAKFNQDISGWNTGEVVQMGAMFNNADAFNQDIGGWNTSKVINMSGMFDSNDAFDQNIGGWDVSQLVNIQNMFASATGLSSVNYDKLLTGWATLDTGETQVPTNLTFAAPPTTYCNGAYARNELDTTYDWTISGDTGLSCGASSSFNTTWQTTTNSESITLPISGSGYLYSVDWGDGNSDSNQTGSAMHTYATAGTYTVTITGSFPRIFFNNTGDKSKILTIAQWGTIQWTSMDRAFRGCNNLTLTATDTPDLSSVTDMGQMFQNATAFADTGGAIGSWNVSNVELMDQVFMNTSFNSNINSWNVSKATNMRNLFFGCSSFNQSLSSWDVSKVTNFSSMFSGASVFNQNIGGWTVNEGINFSGMFQNADDFDQNIGSWNMSKAENLSSMFAGADEFNQNIGSWNTSNVTTMASMFSVAAKFNQDISGWNTSKVTVMGAMFNNADMFNQDIGGWDTSEVINMSGMFDSNDGFNQDVGGWDISKLVNVQNMFASATGLSSANYDKLLTGWANLDAGETQIPTNLTFAAPPTTYCTGAYARNELDTTYDWTFSGDSGLSCATNTFLGLTDNDWNTASNWSGGSVPSNTDAVISPGSTPSAVGDISVANMTIVEDAKLTVAGNLTQTGTLTINSGGSLIAQSSTAFDLTYKRTIATTNWYLVSSAVVNETIQDLISNHSFATGTNSNIGIGDYVNTTPGWTYSTLSSTGTLASGEGRSIKLTGAADFSSTGDMPLADVSITISDGGGGGNGFNLIGNPFPSYLPVNHTSPSASNNLLRANTGVLNQETIWFWDQSLNGGTGDYAQINQASALIDGIRYLAPGQGFFVESNGAGGSFTFAESMQTHQSTDVFSRNANAVPKIKLKVSSGSSEKTTDILYLEGMTTGWDNGYDSTIFGGGNNSFSLFTHLVSDSQGEDLGIQALPNSNYEGMVIPIGLNASSGSSITISAIVTDLPSGINVYLEDRDTNTIIRLDEPNAAYTISLSEDISSIGRFYLYTSANALSIEDEVFEANVSIYLTAPNNLRISGIADGKVKLQLYTIQGKEVLSKQFLGTSVNDLSLPKLSTGIYIVHLRSELGTLNKKLIIDRK